MSDGHTFEYRGTHVVVRWNKDVCIHAGACVRGLPGVFDTARKPWVVPDAADPERVIEAIGRCPSGALSYERLDEVDATPGTLAAAAARRLGSRD